MFVQYGIIIFCTCALNTLHVYNTCFRTCYIERWQMFVSHLRWQKNWLFLTTRADYKHYANRFLFQQSGMSQTRNSSVAMMCNVHECVLLVCFPATPLLCLTEFFLFFSSCLILLFSNSDIFLAANCIKLNLFIYKVFHLTLFTLSFGLMNPGNCHGLRKGLS